MIDIDRLRLRRLELRLSQGQLGKAIGHDQSYVSKVERGQVTGMTVTMLERFALVLRMDPGKLIKTEGEERERLATVSDVA